MSDVLSSAELHDCPVELLPARTVLSLFADSIAGGLLGGSGSGSGSGGGGGGGKSSGGSGSLLSMFGSLLGMGKSGTGPNGTANAGADGLTNG